MGRFNRSNLFSALIGGLVAALLVSAPTVTAAVGDAINVGKLNTGDATTTIKGASAATLKLVNTIADEEALRLVVASGPVMAVNNSTRIPNLNADKLDGKHRSYFLAKNARAADSDLLDGSDSSVFAKRGPVCPPGSLAGYGRLGPICSASASSLIVHSAVVSDDTSLVLDPGGNPVIVYNDRGELKVVHCNDAACAGGDDTPSTVDSAVDAARNPSLVLDAAGYPVIAYDGGGELRVVHCNDAACAGGDETPSIIDAARNPSLVLDAAGYPVIAYDGGGDLKVVHCNDAACAGGDETPSIIDSSAEDGWAPSLVLDARGWPVISHYSVTHRDLMLVHCDDAACAGGDETSLIVDSAGSVGGRSSLVLDASGEPVIAYYDATNDDLKVLNCDDPHCSDGEDFPRTVDSTGDVGRFMSLLLDASGNPVIAYYDGSNGDLKMVHCNDPECVGSETPIIVDSTGSVGEFASLVLDAWRNPVISYWDNTNEALKLAVVVG